MKNSRVRRGENLERSSKRKTEERRNDEERGVRRGRKIEEDR